MCPFTSQVTSAPLLRVAVELSERNGLRMTSQMMIDKITTVSKVKLERRIGRLSNEDLVRLNRAVMVLLGLASQVSPDN